MKPKIAFAWSGLPDYAARGLRSVLSNELYGAVSVLGTRPNVPIKGMEHSLGQKIHWLDPYDTNMDWSNFAEAPPDIFFQGGYSHKAFNHLGYLCKKAGGHVILMSDHNWEGGLRHRFVDPIRHKLFFNSKFDGVFVPGKSGTNYHIKMGYNPKMIVEGLYGADTVLYHGETALSEREKTILFVGQFIERKNVLRLIDAFMGLLTFDPDWRLILCGSGPLRSKIPKHPQIEIHDFVQPAQLAKIMRRSRCLVLPSIEEHWGLVVHEAALSGCALLLSNAVGAVDDLASQGNAILFEPNRTISIEAALRKFSGWGKIQLDEAGRTSRVHASRFGPERFSRSVEDIVAQFSAQK